MSSPGPDDSSAPSLPTPELAGLDPKELLQAGLETVPPVTLPPQPVDSDATIAVARPQPTQPAAQVELPLPEELTKLLPGGNYHVESFLGQGGMGAVYKGVQVRLKRPVAIKIMRRDLGKDYDFEARFEREAQAMAKLNHPNIVSVIDFGEAGPDYLYIVMELIDGADLMDVIRGGQMTQEMALSLLPQICDALQFAHDHGIVHRDIKPSNIMLTRDGRVKMCDFGLAKRYDVESSFRTQTGTGMGTPDYAAPEQFDPKANIDHRADIYALGVMIYQMITGQLPRGVWKPPSQRAEVAPQWDDIVSRAMQSDPSDRYQQAVEVKTDVTSIPLRKEGSANERSAGTPARLNQSGGAAAKNPEAGKSARAPLIFGLLVGAAVVLGVMAFVIFRQKEPQFTQAEHPANEDWKALVSAAEWQRSLGPHHTFQDGLLHLTNSHVWQQQPWADGAIRARIVYRADSRMPSVVARMRGDGRETYKLRITSPSVATLQYLNGESRGQTLMMQTLSKPIAPGTTVLLELRIQGDHITCLVDGVVIGQARDAMLQSPGMWGVYAEDGWFESVEVQPLPAATTPAPIAVPALPESGWKPLVSQTEWQKYSKGTTDYQGQQVTNLREHKDGLLHMSNISLYGTQPFRDGAIRARLVMRAGSEGGGVSGRNSGKQRYFFNLADKGTVMVLAVKTSDSQAGKTLGSYRLPKPLQTDEKFTIELRIQGDQLTGLFNGQEVVRATDQRVKETGTWGIDSSDAWFESVEVQPLPAAATPSPIAAPALPESGWKPLFTDTEWRANATGREFKDGLLHLQGALRKPQASPDGAIRTRIIYREDSVAGGIVMRHDVGGEYALGMSRTGVYLASSLRGKGAAGNLGLYTFPRPLEPGDATTLELRIQDDHLIGLVNGIAVIDKKDNGIKGPGEWGLGSVDACFESVEVQPLPAAVTPAPIGAVRPVSASSPSSKVPAAITGAENVQWHDGVESIRQDSNLAKKLVKEAGGWRVKTGTTGTRFYCGFGPTMHTNVAVRVTYFPAKGQRGEVNLAVRSTSETGWRAQNHDGMKWILDRIAKQARIELLSIPATGEMKSGGERTIELRMVGDTLTFFYNGKVAGTVQDATPGSGRFGLDCDEGVLLKKVEWADLSSAVSPAPNLPVSSSSVATATKDAPFVNTLGMKFVPVPGTQVLFSIWHTRVQDYAAFAKAQEATGKTVDGSWKTQQKDGVPVGRDPDHPVVSVSWDDAQAFCAWLTEKEQSAGRLVRGMRYRLPRDEEWSLAAGLPAEIGGTPEEKGKQNDGAFPWGTDWPPKGKVGNFADETFHTRFPVVRNAQTNKDENLWIEGYTDGYATTSPVGALPANAYGLYDMGGNVWQLCEDRSLAEPSACVLRGGSWYINEPNSLRSSYRSRYVTTGRLNRHGFRVVLALSSGVQAGSTPPPTAEPWVNLLTQPERLALQKTVSLTSEGLTFTGAGSAYAKDSGPDGGIRIRAAFSAGRPELRARQTGSGNYTLSFSSPDTLSLVLYKAQQQSGTPLRQFKLGAPLTIGEDYTLELRASGTMLTVVLNGTILGSVSDGTHAKGDFNLVGNMGHAIKTYEMLVPSRSVVPSPSAAAPDAWLDVLRDPERLILSKTIERTAEGLRFTDSGSAFVKDSGPDGGIRLRTSLGGIRASLRARDALHGFYALTVRDENTVNFARFDSQVGRSTTLRDFNVAAPLQPGQEYQLELRADGPTFTAVLNGITLGSVTDETYDSGDFSVGAPARDGPPTVIRSLELLVTSPAISQSPNLPVSKSSDPKFPPGQWVKLDNSPHFDKSAFETDGWLKPMSQFKELTAFSGKNQAIRFRSRASSTTSGDAHILAVRSRTHSAAPTTRLQLLYSVGSGKATLRRNDGTSATTPILKDLLSLVLEPNAELTMELAVVGDRLISRINGLLQPIVTDSNYADGYLAFRNVFPIRDIEVINLDGLPEAEALRLLGVDEQGKDLRGKTDATK